MNNQLTVNVVWSLDTQIIKDQYGYDSITISIPKDNTDYYKKETRPELELDRQLDSDL